MPATFIARRVPSNYVRERFYYSRLLCRDGHVEALIDAATSLPSPELPFTLEPGESVARPDTSLSVLC